MNCFDKGQAAAWWMAAVAAIVLSDPSSARAISLEQKQAELDLRHVWNFDKDAVGTLPPGFIPAQMGAGPAGEWKVESDQTAPSGPHRLSQTASCPGGCFHLLLADGLVYDYVDVTTRFRALTAGATGAGTGGLVFRYRDAKNFYAAVIDLAASSLEVVKVTDGQVQGLAMEPVKPSPSPWHYLRVKHDTILSKDAMEVWFDGKIIFSTWDKERFGGQIGLVSKGTGPLGFDNIHAIRLYSQHPLSPPAAY